MRQIFCVAIFLFSVGKPVHCGAANSDRQLELDWLIIAEYHRQEFDYIDANIYSLQLQPSLTYGNWLLTVNVPWYSIDSKAFLNPRQQYIQDLCTSREPRLLAASDRSLLDERREIFCDSTREAVPQDSRENGVGDIGAWVSYGNFLSDSYLWYGSLTVGYLADNGDEDKAIGGGTRNIYSDGLLNIDNGRLGASLLVGYNWIAGGEYRALFDDYYYASTDLYFYPVQFGKWLAGLNWSFLEKNFDDAGPGDSSHNETTGVFIDLTLEKIRLRLAADYNLRNNLSPDYDISLTSSYRF